ncbi:MAG: DISARM system SNF2-like helicase DrmD, partial [Acidobacteriota bacterium]|nr:DISARM system SNF2-like helicase DrmD [Acidobacteriota bacterium]
MLTVVLSVTVSILSRERRLPKTGEIVHLRQRLYLVDDVVPSSADGTTVVRGSCIDDDAQGQQIEALWELELDAEVRNAESWGKLAERGFDPPDRFAAYLNTMRWNCVTSTDARLLQAPFRAGIKLEPYQLEPLRKALRLPRVNLFIADDVGLGKTIEAALIARELLLRKKVREIVVSCPPSMLLQWQEELQNRFGLRFEILNKEYIKNVRRERGFSVNPWTTHTRFLISHRLLIDEAYTSGLRDWLGSFKPGSLLILDEAHHAAPASGQKLAIDSDITKAVRGLAGRFEHRLFLSATPHNGHSNSFSALLAMLDPQRFTRGIPVTKQNRDEVMVRRIKEDLRVIQGGFPKREVKQVTLEAAATEPELELFRLLSQYQEALEARLSSKAFRLVLCHLQQRLFSSINAFARTLKVHRRSVVSQQAKVDEALLFRGLDADDDRASLTDEQIELERDAQVEAASALIPAAVDEEGLLDEMTALAERSRYAPDARVRWLFDWLKTNVCPGGEWNSTRVIIFTEYEDTLHYLKRQLSGELPEAESRIETFSGATSRREEIKAAFNTEPAKHPLRILLATDAAREGLNLQAYCQHLFHFDVPWNPSRMEQRNGRIDRKLQPADEVYCYYFVYANRPEDKILQTIVRKTEKIRKELGSLSTVIDRELERLLKGGIRRSEIETTAREIGGADLDADKRRAIEDELETTRQLDLRKSIDRLRTLMDDSRKEVGLDEGHFRSAISCALEMMGAEPLRDLGGGRYALPKLDDTDRSWASTMDSLREPKAREQKLYEWRNSSPIRPVVFEDPGRVTDEVVQFHLEQQVVQRLLSRFLAQGFQLDDLSRACLAQTRDAIPRVILLGRLALYGPG